MPFIFLIEIIIAVLRVPYKYKFLELWKISFTE